MTFCELIQFESFCDRPCRGATVLSDLFQSGKSGRAYHMLSNGFPQWESLCALEDALIDAGQNKDWWFIAGDHPRFPEVRGWLEHDGCAIVPYGPDQQRDSGSQIGLWGCADWLEEAHTAAMAQAAPESGIQLNAQLRAIGESGYRGGYRAV